MTLREMDTLIAELHARLKAGPNFQRLAHAKNVEYKCKVIEWERRLKNFLHYCRETRRVYQYELENDLI